MQTARWIRPVVVSVLMVLLTACGSAQQNPPSAQQPDGQVAEKPVEQPAQQPDEQPDAPPIKVGFYAPLTGPAAADGEAARRGAELAVKLINAQGGVQGRNLDLVVYDDAFSPDEAANVTRRLIEQDKVDVVISGSYSFTTRAGAPIAQAAKVPFIAAYGVHPSITETGEYVWRIGALATVQGKAGAELVVKKLGARKIAILIVDNDFGVSLAEAFKARAQELGTNVVYEQKYPLGESDFRPLLGGIAQAKPDVLYAIGYFSEASALAQQAQAANLGVQIVGQEGYDSPTFLELAGDAANGIIFTTDLNRDSDRPAVQAFLEKFQAEYSHPADAVAASCYDAVQVAAAAIQAANSTEPAAVLKGLQSLVDFQGAVTGPIERFTAGREVVRPIGAQIVRDNAFHFYAEIDDPEVVTPPK